ncbi:MAG: NAD-dependent epimerase/dehydratase family protein [Acidobacteria bacterium]|nr:MAG: NAD-dependent epimerase/dehydratase family protein [Acidobacteriota bacterium]
MRVLISGITGFVGDHLARALLDEHEVWGFANEAGTPPAGCEVRVVDLLDEQALTELVAEARPQAVVHLAGLSHVGASFDRPAAYRRVNAGGTHALCRALAAAAPRALLVVASSAEVYGPVPASEQPIVEERSPDPRSPYAESKVEAEQLALAAGGVVVRPFNIIGPGQAPTFALPAFAQQLARIRAGRQEAVIRVGDLSPRRDFTHVGDAVAAYRLLLERGAPGVVYNLASGRAVAMREVLERLMAIAGVTAEIRPDPARFRPCDAPVMCGDGSRLRALGWAPARDLDHALRDLWCHTVAG